VQSLGLARWEVVAGRRDADILLEILLSEGATGKLVGGERYPQHRWWAPRAAILVRMVWRCRTMEAVNGARDHCGNCVHPMPGCPSRQLSKIRSDWGISGREGMNIMDTHTERPLSRDLIYFGPFRLSVTERNLKEGGVPVRLGSRALDILIALVERPAEVVTKKELFARVWPDLVVDEGSLRYHVSALRKALGEGRSATRYVANVSGRGYCFVVPISRASPGLRAGYTI